MKKVLLLLTLTTISFVWAQEPYYDAENDEHSNDATATEIISSEPVIIASIIGNTDPAIQEVSDSTPETDMTASMEMLYTEYSNKINIPLWYRWRDYSFNATIPYILKKEIPLGTESVEASGFGDISIGAAYGKYLEQYNTYLCLNATVKLPTGDEENTVKDSYDFSQPVPLGSGTTDIAGTLSGYYFMDSFTFKSNIMFKMNGTFETELWDGSKQETDIGDLFLFTAGADYRWQYNLTFGLDMIYGNRSASEIEGTDQENGMSYIDFTPNVKYAISLFEFVLGVKVPVSTTLEDDSFNEGNRSIGINFRTNYRIF